MLDRAQAANCPAIVFTVDLPVPGTRYRDRRSGLTGAPGFVGQMRRLGQALVRPHWCWNVGFLGRPLSLGNVAGVLGSSAPLGDFLRWLANNFDPAATWADLEWVRRHWSGPLIVKGILHPDDASEAVACGADAIVVSNHGGRQLDGAISAAKSLPAIIDVVGSPRESLRMAASARASTSCAIDRLALMPCWPVGRGNGRWRLPESAASPSCLRCLTASCERPCHSRASRSFRPSSQEQAIRTSRE